MSAKWLAVVVTFGLSTLSEPAQTAPRSAADRAADEAEALANAGDFAGAAAKFRVAWQTDRLRSELFCNIGISWYKAKDLVRAHLLLGQCLEQAALDPKMVQSVRTALVSVEGVLRASGHTPVRVAVDPPTTTLTIAELAPDITFVGSRVVWLAFGTYHLSAHAEGYATATETIIAASGAPQTVTVTLRKHVEIQLPKPVDAAPRPNSVEPPRRSWIPAIALTSAAVLATGVGAYAWVEGHRRADLASGALDAATYDEDRRAVDRWNTTLVVAGVVAGVTAVASSYVWYRTLHVEPRIEAQAHHASVALSVVGRF